MTSDSDRSTDRPIRIPVVEERLLIDKQRVETGRVTVATTVDTHHVAVADDLRRTSIEVERVPIDRYVDDIPQTRTESDVTIVPVIEEVMVKRIRLIEEVRLTRRQAVDRFEQHVPLRRMDVTVTREDDTATETRATTDPGG